MADETRLTRTTGSVPQVRTAPPPARSTPDDPEAARAEIEATRARMSETIDEIEEALLARKEKIRDQLDVLAPVREQPLKTLGMVFGAALLLGLITGGKGDRHRSGGGFDPDRYPHLRGGGDLPEPDHDEDDGDEEELEAAHEAEAAAWRRAEEWEDRAHRLLRIARAQENELEIHRERQEKMRRQLRSRARHEVDDYDEDDEDEGEPNVFERVRESAAERLATLASEVSQRIMRGG